MEKERNGSTTIRGIIAAFSRSDLSVADCRYCKEVPDVLLSYRAPWSADFSCNFEQCSSSSFLRSLHARTLNDSFINHRLRCVLFHRVFYPLNDTSLRIAARGIIFQKTARHLEPPATKKSLRYNLYVLGCETGTIHYM